MKRLVVEDELGEEAKVLEKDRALATSNMLTQSHTHAQIRVTKACLFNAIFCLAVS